MLILVTDGWDISIALRWTSLDLNDDKSTLVQVMAWCHQATSHYLNLCWPRSLPPYGVTRPQWVNSLKPNQNGGHFMEDIFKGIFLKECCILAQILLRFVSKDPIVNKSSWVQVMVCYLYGTNHNYTLRTTKLLEVYWFHSVCPSCMLCPLCSTYSSGWILFIFIHLIKQLQKVCRM